MTDEEIIRSVFKCIWEGCMRHPSRGDTIIRINQKGIPFEGLCEEHLGGVNG